VAGDRNRSLPGHGHRRLFGCQRSSPAVAGVVAAVQKNFAIWIELSRSRRGARLAGRVKRSQK
jgi:hypothetical protein